MESQVRRRSQPHAVGQSTRRSATLVVSAFLVAGGCGYSARVAAPTSPAEVGEFRGGFLNGYLSPAALPDSLVLLPGPPMAGSAAQADDEAAFFDLTKLQGTARGALAVKDADLRFPGAAETFSCALGLPVSEKDTPNLNILLRRTLTDAALATYKKKDDYQRTRPFVVFNVSSCTPAEDSFLAKDGSYPSGHTAIGWAWALVLTELVPDRADAILQRGRAFGQSRGICGAHWLSDIESGRIIGAATVARLHANPVFVAQMNAAQKEIAAARGRGNVAAADCRAESGAIATSSPAAP